MKRKRRLHELLARQWIAFALVLFAGFSAMTILLAYMLEDRLIDERLRDIGRQLVLQPEAALPAGFVLLERSRAGGALHERTEDQPLDSIREFRMPDGRYLHVLAMRDPQDIGVLLIHDATGQLAVNPALARAWPWLLLIAATLTLCAWALARRLVARISGQAVSLVARFDEADGPEDLRALADSHAIFEFGELARLHAKAWEARQTVLDRERETLAFLAHELRTPLQSARTSLALLDARRDPGKCANHAAWQRLHRAVNRLARASHAVLWLGEGQGGTPGPCQPGPLLRALIEEFAPLAAARGQFLHGPSGPDVAWPMPEEVAETVLTNLLLNAIQHGSQGEIHIQLDGTRLCIDNPLPVRPSPSGFGIGQQLAARLLERFGGTLLQQTLPDGRLRVEVDPGHAPTPRPERHPPNGGDPSPRPR